MIDLIKKGRWFDVITQDQHNNLKSCGKLTASNSISPNARLQKGDWSGPGKYMLLSYEQRCPRNCCYDSVNHVVSASDVTNSIREEMRSLAGILREAKDIGE